MKSMLLTLVLLSAGCVSVSSIEERKSWSKIEVPHEISALAHATCFADAENFYVFSGIDENGIGPFNNVGYTYSIKKKSWERWAQDSGPRPIQNFSSARTEDHFYVFGGQSSGDIKANDGFYRYSLKDRNWEILPVKQGVKGRLRSAAAIQEDKFVVYGGNGDDEGPNTAVFDISNQNWTVLDTPMALASRVSEVFAAIGNRLVVLGGFIDSKPQDSGYVLDVASGKWSEFPNPLLGSRVNPKFVWNSSRLYVIGGATNSESQLFGAFYDVVQESWEPIPRIKGFLGYKGYEIAQVKDDGIILWGGRNPKDNSYNDILYFYRFKSHDWVELKLENSPPGTIGACLVSNENRDVFAFGGIYKVKGSGLRHLDRLWMLSALQSE